jgi:NADPH:quinone reductase-like Zn-dependent oxidoreductase
MLTGRGRLPDGGSVLVQGAGGGVASAAIVLARALDATVYVTSRDAAKLKQAVELGAVPVEPGARLPERVDVVIDTVGRATLGHSLKALKAGGRCVIAGATSGHLVEVDLRQVFFRQLSLVGSTMGTREELDTMLALVARKGLRPIVDSTFALAEARTAFVRMLDGEAFGKIVLTC